MRSWSIAKGMAGTLKCLKMLSLVPKAVLNGWKYPAIKIKASSVVIANDIKVLLKPWVIIDIFLVLQTKELKIWHKTTP